VTERRTSGCPARRSMFFCGGWKRPPKEGMIMIDGIIDNLKLNKTMVYRDRLMLSVDKEGNLIQSEEQAGEYVKRFKKRVEDGEILRYFMLCQIPSDPCYKKLADDINRQRKEEVDRLNEEYYGKEKYLKKTLYVMG
jgi:hypothetical protein